VHRHEKGPVFQQSNSAEQTVVAEPPKTITTIIQPTTCYHRVESNGAGPSLTPNSHTLNITVQAMLGSFRFPPSHSFITFRCPPPRPSTCSVHLITLDLITHIPSGNHYQFSGFPMLLITQPVASSWRFQQSPKQTMHKHQTVQVQHGTPKFEPSTSQKPHTLCQQPKFSP
jgi:hypothetical protein